MRNATTRLFAAALAFTMYLAAGPGPVVAQLNCQPSNTPVTTTGSITTSDPTQAGRVARDGVPSTCFGKTNGLTNSTAIHYKSFNFTSPVTGCATVDINTSACGDNDINTTEVVAYSNFNPASPGTNVIGDPGFSLVGTASFGFPVTAGQNFTIVVHEINQNAGCASFSFKVSYSTGCRQVGFDRTNDGKADPTVFRPSTGDWFMLNSAGGVGNERFGKAGDILTGGDYTGDGQTDVSVYRPSNSTWYYALDHSFPTMAFSTTPWGVANDVAVPGDYDRDGKTDIAIWRPSTGIWYIMRSSNNTLQTLQWGLNGDTPVIGDFDGDRVVDYAVVRPSGDNPGQYTWWILLSNFDFGFYIRASWGLNTDKPVPADYDGDGATDVAVWRPSNGTWYTINTNTLTTLGLQWGANGDIPQPADYDGDKKADFTVFRPSSNIWYILRSSDKTVFAPQWGQAGDQPATAAYQIQ